MRTDLRIFIASCFALAACSSGAGTRPAEGNASTAERVTSDRPPSGYVATPFGYYHASCIHEIAAGAEYDIHGTVLSADGATTAVPDCAYPRIDLATPKGETNGWVEYSGWVGSAPVTQMTSKFTVPAAPATTGTQTIFLFPGMEPASGTIILQPVLQWGVSGAGGGTDWEVASWSCGSRCVHSALVPVTAGDELLGTIKGSLCTATGQCHWEIVTDDTTTGMSTTLRTHDDTNSYVWLQSGVLEVYTVTACTDYPAGGSEAFSAVRFHDVSGNPVSPAWAPTVMLDHPACGFAVTTAAAGARLTF